MRRREVIRFLGGAAVGWPLAAGAQQGEHLRRFGVLMNLAADDPERQAGLAAFVQGLHELGWTDRRNVRTDSRWTAGNDDRFRAYAAELMIKLRTAKALGLDVPPPLFARADEVIE